MIPIKLPKIELNTAAASFPPIAFVIMTAEETGGGMQLTVSKLKHKTYLKTNIQSV